MTMRRDNISHLSLHFIFVGLLIASTLILGVDSRTYPEDIRVLRDLKRGIDPKSMVPGSCLSSWEFSVDPCDHIFGKRFTCGFRCDQNSSGFLRVTEITLDQVGYYGSLSSASWNLPYLQILDISGNYFYGFIPHSLSNLTQLRKLGLSRNLLSGEVPASITSLFHLEELYLDDNNIYGSIPSSINSLTNLTRLEIQGNHLSGEFPDLGSLKHLNFLDASNNLISGRLPTSFPVSLTVLSMRNNFLEGNLPNSIGDSLLLQVLDLSYNRISGLIPSDLFDHPSLQQLTLSHNNFSFLQEPSTMGFTSKLIAIDLSNNDLVGFLPAFLCSMPKLSALSLEFNKFTGMIPIQYALKAVVPARPKTSSFQRLLLGGNYLFGPIPGPLMGLKPGYANVSLVYNCLYKCPNTLFFCQGRIQKSLVVCKRFWHAVP